MQSGVANVLELNSQFSAVGGPYQKDFREPKKSAPGMKLGAITTIGTTNQPCFHC
tara:strand:- start:873 stop:1037 length:165 start_codon:yes stop_codon:yes gene_type:complete